jgi:hypothetical protein
MQQAVSHRVARPYTELAAMYDATLGVPIFVGTRRAFEELVRRYGIHFRSAADIGCGTGLFTPDIFAPGLSRHVFLITVRGEPPVPILHRGNPLHPMQVILTGKPGDMPPLAGLEAAIGPLPALPPPHLPMRSANASAPLMPREIIGEILCDASSRLYEKVGDYVRPVNQLSTGSRGEIIDLVPIRAEPHEAVVPSASGHGQWGAAATTDASSAADAGNGYAGAKEDDAPPGSDELRGKRSLGELARRLTPEPGLWRLVRYADFIDVFMPQLADPRRLQPRHQLACYLQMYEVGAAMPISALEDAAARELGAAGKLIPLSYDLCRRFGLSLPRPAFALASAPQVYSPEIAPAGARFMTLRVALDPTAEVVAPRPTSAAVSSANTMSAPQDAFSDGPMVVTTPVLKTSIPEEFSKPWDRRLSREEALYDMALAASRGTWQRLLDSLLNRVSRRDMKRWHALLLGKTPDQQLWTVKPPKGGLRDSRVRCWVEQILQLGGYDVARMLTEWEVHWRRRGF